MYARHVIAVCFLALMSSWACADDPKPDQYVRVEIKGKLEKYAPNPIRMPNVKGYVVTVGRDGTQQSFELDLPNDELGDQAKDLAGKPVLISGELSFKTVTEGRPKGDPLRKN